ncbi:MAG TPA: alpha/beta fold hydrolase [Burkholderiaceae bacterium]|nr:alpha/beta fold hydrolase [Burkholderiaceae bacterium]
MAVAQELRFCISSDGTRIGYARTGRGNPIVKAANWLTHIELDLMSRPYRPLIEELSRIGQLVRYDQRGCGLSDRAAADVSLDAHVADLAAVIDAVDAQKVVLFGLSQGGAIAARYTALNPHRVSHLVLLNAYAQGVDLRDVPATVKETARLLTQLVRLGNWKQPNPAFAQLFTTQLMPDAPPEVARAFNEMMRLASSPEQAARLLESMRQLDATDSLPLIRCPTLVCHSRSDAQVPFEEGRRIASAIPDARFVPLESRSHLLLDDEPAWTQFFRELRAFLAPAADARGTPAFGSLTAGERRLLDHLASGLDNAQIAARLGLAEKTVRNTITRIFDKLAVENRAQAIVLARDAGFGQRVSD